MEWIKKEFVDTLKKPKSWFSIKDIETMTGQSSTTVRRRIDKMVKNGELEEKIFMDRLNKAKCYHKIDKKK